jgi:hypothetical protein
VESILKEVGRFLLDITVITANGFIATWFFVLDALPQILSLICAFSFLALFDRRAELVAAWRPHRRGVRPPLDASRAHRVLTASCILLWLFSSFLYPEPVPWLGAAMWLTSVLSLLILPAERIALLWRTKVSILIYSISLLGFRWYLFQVSRLSAREWARVLGSVGEAERIIAGNVGLFTTIGTWLAWFVLPCAHAMYIVQRATVNPMSLVNPFQSVAEIIREIRTRER